MTILLSAATVGGLAVFALLWPCGILLALAGAPFGGSIAAAAAAIYLARRRTETHRDDSR